MGSSGAGTDPGLYARSFADVYDAWYGELDDPRVLVRAFLQRCQAGAIVVEMGSGTGRLATPLHRAGFEVIALDASLDMLVDAATGPIAVAADMAKLPLSSKSADAALVAYNTLFNLASRAQQQACFHELGRVLRRGGIVAIEAFVAPGGAPVEFGISTRQHPVRANAQLAILSGPDQHDPDIIVGSHVELGSATTCRPWRLVYQSPAQLDDCAKRSGLVLQERCSSWDGERFEANSERHVSWYQKL